MTTNEYSLFVSAVSWYLQKQMSAEVSVTNGITSDSVGQAIDAIVEETKINISVDECKEVAALVLKKFA